MEKTQHENANTQNQTEQEQEKNIFHNSPNETDIYRISLNYKYRVGKLKGGLSN